MGDVEVLVVGAGPTGLMAACWLARLGTGVRVIDPKPGPTRESRALVLQARSMEILDQLGVVDAVLQGAEPAQALSPGYGRRAFGRVRLGRLGGGLTPYPRVYVFEQSKTEALLADTTTGLGGTIGWGERLTDVRDEDGAVVATVASGAGTGEVRTRYLIGADGASSAVRDLLGIDFAGVTNAYTFFVCDAVEVSGLRDDTVSVRFAATEFLLCFPMRGVGSLRLVGTVPGTGELTEERVRRRLADTFGVRWGASRWYATYRVHHRVAETFRRGGCFLAGDAAHVHSPVGAQGMNTGLQDAHNLAMALADVLRRGAPEGRLDSYELERRPVALRLISTTDRVFGFVVSRRWLPRLLRVAVLPLLAVPGLAVVPLLGMRRRLFGYVAQLRIHYWMTDAARTRGRRGRVVGRRLPWTGDNVAVLASADWQVHAYGAVPAGGGELVERLGLSLHVFGPAPRATGLQAGVMYLVRPDGFVAAAATPEDAESAFEAAGWWRRENVRPPP